MCRFADQGGGPMGCVRRFPAKSSHVRGTAEATTTSTFDRCAARSNLGGAAGGVIAISAAVSPSETVARESQMGKVPYKHGRFLNIRKSAASSCGLPILSRDFPPGNPKAKYPVLYPELLSN
jgi:hypothetical protein